MIDLDFFSSSRLTPFSSYFYKNENKEFIWKLEKKIPKLNRQFIKKNKDQTSVIRKKEKNGYVPN